MTAAKSNWKRWLIIALLFIVPLLPFYVWGQLYDPLAHAYKSVSSDFRIHQGDLSLQQAMADAQNWRTFDAASDGIVRGSGYYWFRLTLPDNRWRDPHLFIQYLRNGEIYLDGQLIYAFHADEQRKQWIDLNQAKLIPLPQDFAGKELFIRTSFANHWVHPGITFIDDSLKLVLSQLMNSSYRLVIGLISLLIAISSMMLYLARRARSYLYFSLFASVVVYACFALSWSLFSLIIPWPHFNYFYPIVILFGGYCFIRFFIEIFGAGVRNIHLRLSQTLLILIPVMCFTAVAAPSFYVYYMQNLINFGVAPVFLGLITFTSIMTYRRNRLEETFWYMAGFVTFALFTTYSFVQYDVYAFVNRYAAALKPVIQAFHDLLYHNDYYLHSIFVLMFCMMMILRSRIQSMYTQAKQTAAELAVMSESLEKLVKERTAELEESNRHLRESIEETSQALAEIAVLEDRNRIAQDMHDHLGNDLTAALIQIEAAKMLLAKDVNKALAKLEATRVTVNRGLTNIRQTVRMMKSEYDSHTIISAFQKLIAEAEERTGVKIKYSPEPLPHLEFHVKKALFHALQEGLTNGIRHGNATLFKLTVKTDGRALHFRLSNNGDTYAAEEQYGFGLSTMRERIARLGGTLRISDNGGTGCLLAIDIPHKEQRAG